MGGKSHRVERGLTLLESVRCLSCGGVYSKPAGGGTAATNPGCPECGYIGWLPISAQGEWLPPRFAGDRPQHRSA